MYLEYYRRVFSVFRVSIKPDDALLALSILAGRLLRPLCCKQSVSDHHPKPVFSQFG